MTEPKTFRKNPVEIQAMHWDGTRAGMEAICEWVNGYDDGSDDATIAYNYTTSTDVRDVFISTLEGDMRVSDGDFVIRGVQGEFYPCKPDIFAATYEPVQP